MFYEDAFGVSGGAGGVDDVGEVLRFESDSLRVGVVPGYCCHARIGR